MSSYVNIGNLKVASVLAKCVENEIAPGTGIDAGTFWTKFSDILDKYGEMNAALLRKRDAIQAQIDEYVLRRKGKDWNRNEYETFLRDIGYLVKRGPDFKIDVKAVDKELTSQPGPQLVVPASNARYALNAANARWGSLLDAFYGTDVVPETDGAEKTKKYNPKRGKKVFTYAHKFLDEHFPLSGASYDDVVEFRVKSGSTLICSLRNGKTATLRDSNQFVGFIGSSSVLLKHNGLHAEILLDRSSQIGSTHPAGLKDVLLEAAISSIIDFEDSVSAVDAEDKTNVYSNWAGLMKGTLSSSFSKGDRTVTRRLQGDKVFTSTSGGTLRLHGRSLLLVRNVSLHMYTDAVLDARGRDVPEGMLDLMVSALAVLHDLKKTSSDGIRNTRTGSMYVLFEREAREFSRIPHEYHCVTHEFENIYLYHSPTSHSPISSLDHRYVVKPKMHGPEEVRFTDQVFAAVEDALGMPRYTIKMGIMDEERRTSVNLAECIRAAKHRVIFINTGFLDRTGDEIHTTFLAGAMLPKKKIKSAIWRKAYEDQNVDVGISCGLVKKGQIGKGMWAAPDAMKNMLATKAEHPLAGATCAWVRSFFPVSDSIRNIT